MPKSKPQFRFKARSFFLQAASCLTFLSVIAIARAEDAKRPVIKKLGTIDLLMVETTPVAFKDRLYRFEYIRETYPGDKAAASYFRFIEMATGRATPAFAKGMHLGCAYAEGDTMYVFGVDKYPALFSCLRAALEDVRIDNRR
jgi:hypothetical protein